MKRTQLPRIIILHIIFGTVSAPFGQHRRPKLASGFASWHGGFPHTVGGNRRSNGPKIGQHTLHLPSSAVSQHQLAAHALLWYHHQEPAESDSDGVDYERERERDLPLSSQLVAIETFSQVQAQLVSSRTRAVDFWEKHAYVGIIDDRTATHRIDSEEEN